MWDYVVWWKLNSEWEISREEDRDNQEIKEKTRRCFYTQNYWVGEIRKELGDLKKEVKDTTKKNQMMETRNLEKEREIQQLKDQNKLLQTSITTLECKSLDNYLRLRGIPEEKGENIFELMVDKIATVLGKQPEDINYNFKSIYRVNSHYEVQKQLPKII